MAVALLFSVPANAPCYEEARARSIGVWNDYQQKECEKQLIKLRAMIAMAQSKANADSNYYTKAMDLIKDLQPTDKCYSEVKRLVDQLDKKFDTRQREEWALIKKLSQDEVHVKKEMFKAMGKMSASYQPSDKLIIVH